MKEKRDISGIYFRFFNPGSNSWENWCFEDLPESEQDKILSKSTTEFVYGLCKSMANTLNKVCEKFDITTNP